MQRGEVRWYRFPQPDKKRPALILTRDSVLDLLAEVTVAPITSTVRDIPSEVPLGPEDGMPRRCAVNLDHLQTVAKARVGPLITTLRRETMTEVERHYRDIYVTERGRLGLPAEPIDRVSGTIESRIRDERLARQTADWVRDLRGRADIQIRKDCLK